MNILSSKYTMYKTSIFEDEVKSIFDKNADDLNSTAKESVLTKFQKAAGFTSSTAGGSRHFDQVIGNLLHKDICPLSQKFRELKIHESRCDGRNDTCLFEVKSKYTIT